MIWLTIILTVFFTPIGLHQLYLQFTTGEGSWLFIWFGIFWPLALYAQFYNRRRTATESRPIGFREDNSETSEG